MIGGKMKKVAVIIHFVKNVFIKDNLKYSMIIYI